MSNNFKLGEGGKPSRKTGLGRRGMYSALEDHVKRTMPVAENDTSDWSYVDVKTFGYAGKELNRHVEKYRSTIRRTCKQFHHGYKAEIATITEDAPDGYTRVWFRIIPK